MSLSSSLVLPCFAQRKRTLELHHLDFITLHFHWGYNNESRAVWWQEDRGWAINCPWPTVICWLVLQRLVPGFKGYSFCLESLVPWLSLLLGWGNSLSPHASLASGVGVPFCWGQSFNVSPFLGGSLNLPHFVCGPFIKFFNYSIWMCQLLPPRTSWLINYYTFRS